jgi:hypothetical protein
VDRAGGLLGGAGCRRRGKSGGGRRWLAGVTRKRDSSLEFGLGLAQEIVRKKGNSIRGFRRSDGSRTRRPAVRGGDSERIGARGKQGEREINRPERILTPQHSF